ncbi:hypothetical protein Ae201684P_012381 [Aphanomyces euteiches]|uniref:Uncharacterized protein n=1 Tax=Aphanomyces euteiches TaxID=100861 RepID=A0A6G0WZ25_9STRA|nr:hypothetical protein Ae201684_010190 [Aphanomyces euteiches]KAH9075888.1 hypothetical protein Ae201684P_012381 [Aphanomyces euteiches]
MVAWTGDSSKCSECVACSVEGRSSMDILISWITYCDRRGNYTNWMRFKGAVKTKTGSSKKTIANEISTLLRSHGLHRDGPSVLDKIARLNASFIQAKGWERQTGQGLLNNVRENFDSQSQAQRDEALAQTER